MDKILDSIQSLITIIAFIFSAISLFVYTQRDKQSYMRIDANSRKLSFVIDLENSGVNLAYIKKIEVYKSGEERKKNAKPIEQNSLDLVKRILNESKVSEDHYTSRSCTDLTGEVIIGNGTKHHLFSCSVTDLDDLKKIWNTLKKYEIKVIYRDVYGLLTKKEKDCYSHFKSDYDSFIIAMGDRKGFSED